MTYYRQSANLSPSRFVTAKRKMKSALKPSVSYREDLLRRLKDPEFAAGYLTRCLEDSEGTFLVGLRDVAEVHGGIRRLAKTTDLNREHLFRMLSRQGNPRLHSLRQLVGAVGLKLAVRPA